MTRIASKATKRNGKGKRWLRGQSSSSNPENTKHRTRAKQILSGESTSFTVSTPNRLTLTKDVLEKFDAVQEQKQRSEAENVDSWLEKKNEVDSVSQDGFTVGNASAASVWTNCTNVSFDRFLNGFNPKSRIHKSMLAVLATVREAIERENGSETETEYFAALMLTLNCVQSEEKLTATVALIKMILKHVSPSVLRGKFSQTSSVLVKILSEQLASQTSNSYLIKSIIGSLATLLRHQEAAIWQLNSTQQIFETLLMLILHPKPRIRKAASFAVISLTCDPNAEAATGVVRNLVAQFCIRKLEEHLTTSSDEHLNILLYIFGLLSDVMCLFPSVKHTKRASETILSHMTLGNILIVTGALQTFYSFFIRRPDSKVLSSELNARLVNALYDYQPNMNDEQPLKAWCTTMKEALLSLYELDVKLYHVHLLKFVRTTIGCLQSDSPAVHSVICNAIAVVMKNVIIDLEQADSNAISEDLAKQIYAQLEVALKYQYSHAWTNIVPMLAELFAKSMIENVGHWMQRLAIIRDSNHAEVNAAIDQFFGVAVKFYGPRIVLAQCPITWTISASERMSEEVDLSESYRGEFTNSWLLPIVRDKTEDNAELDIFFSHFLPLAEELGKKEKLCQVLRKRLEKSATADDSMDIDDGTTSASVKALESTLVMHKELKRYVHAIWSLLPAFCRRPVDVEEIFPKIAKKLGDTLYDRELCLYPLAALHNLFKCKPEVQIVVVRFAKNYLPILFNVYTNENENAQIDQGLRLSVLHLVEAFIPHLFSLQSTEKLFRSFYELILSKLNESNSEYRKMALLDLLRAFLASPNGLTAEDVSQVYFQIAKPLIANNATATEQKKGFRFLKEITVNPSEICQQFMHENLKNHVDFLFSLFESSKRIKSPSAKALGLQCLQQIIEQYLMKNSKVEIDWFDYFDRILLVIFAVLQIRSVKAKKSATDLLLLMADGCRQLALEDPSLTFKLARMIVGPLSNGNLTITERVQRVNAISILYSHKYHQPLVPQDIECYIADAVISLIPESMPGSQSKASTINIRTLTSICFEFIRHFFSHTTPDVLNTYLELITCNITKLPQEIRNKFHMEIKMLLIKLIRRFGFELINSMIHEDYKKILKNIYKDEERKKRKKKAKKAEESEANDEDLDRRSRYTKKSALQNSSDEEEEQVEQFIDDQWSEEEEDVGKKDSKFDITSRLSSKTVKTFIKESVDDDPIDLLNSQTSKSLFSNIPQRYKQTNVQPEAKQVPLNEDGKLLIEELFEQIELKSSKNPTKRKLGESESEGSEEEDSEDEMFDLRSRTTGKSYKPGGKGIHRPVSASGQSVASRKSGKSANQATGSVNRADPYKSNKAAGDMKRKGLPDPYAYYPLNVAALNKRKARKMKGQFKSVVRGALKGATADHKQRAKRQRTSK